MSIMNETGNEGRGLRDIQSRKYVQKNNDPDYAYLS